MRTPDARVVTGWLLGSMRRASRQGALCCGWQVVAEQAHGLLTVELVDTEGAPVAVYVAQMIKVGL